MNLDLDGWFKRRWVRIGIWAAVFALSALKFCHLFADFPNWSPWMMDQAKFTDEGWWANAAVMHTLTGHWFVAGDYNPAVALPVWPVLLGVLFHFTGVSVIAARALNVAISIATLCVVYLLVPRFSEGREAPALLAVLLLASSPFAFVFNRLAILETVIVFEFCALMLAATFVTARRAWPLFVIMLLATAMLLTKTTGAVLLPAVLWVAWSAMGRKFWTLVRVGLAVAVVPALLVKSYAAIVAGMGYGADYKYFFDVNALPEIEWGQTVTTFHDFFVNCFWVDRVLYPLGVAILVLAVAWQRKLWSNPLFTASWMVLAAEAVFILRRQDDYAPRYFFPMLAPLVWIVVLTFGELLTHAKKTAWLLVVVTGGAVIANGWMIGGFLTRRSYDYRDAAESIAKIIRSHPEQKALTLGVSGPQIALMTGIPAINDYYGTEDGAAKVARYQPGWYLAWNGVDADNKAMLAPFELEKMTSYPVFDDDDRTTLDLYKMVRK